MGYQEARPIAVRCQERKFRLSNLLDEVAVIAAVCWPEEVLPGNEVWRLVLQFDGTPSHKLLMFLVAQSWLNFAKLRPKRGVVSLICRDADIYQPTYCKALFADKIEIAWTIERSSVSGSAMAT